MNWRVWLIAALMVLPTVAQATNGFRPIGYGTKSKGMGGVGVALPQDAFAAALNPAGLGFVCDRLDVGVQWLRDKGDARLIATLPVGTSGSRFTEQNLHSRKDLWWPEAAVSWVYCPCCALGVSAYAWGGWKIDYNERSILGTADQSIAFAGFEGTDLGANYQVYFVTPAWACNLFGNHTLGVAANIAIATLSTSGLERFESEVFSAFPEYVTDKGTEFEHGLGLHFGWIGQFDCGLTVGLSYKTKTWMNHFKKYRGFIPEDGNLDLPSIWSLGVTWCVTPYIVISADFERIMWTDAKLFRHDLFNIGRFGTKSGQGFGWEDQSVIKLGAAWDITGALTLRAGFNYGTNLYANRDLFLNAVTLGAMKRHLTIGLTYYNGCHEFSLDYIHGYHNSLGWNDLGNTTILGLTTVGAKNRISQDSVGVSYGYHY